MVKTLCQTMEQPASLSLIVPLAMRRVQVRRLQQVTIMPRFISRPLLQPTLPSPPTCLARCCSLDLIRRLYFPARYSLNNFLLTLRSSTHWGCIRTMSLAGLLGALYVYMTLCMHLAFPRSLLFILLLFPLPPSLGCRLPSQTVSLQSVAGEVLGQLGGRVL